MAADLKSALKYFYETNPTVLAAQESIKVQNEAFVQAQAAFGPQVTLNFDAQYQQAKIDQTNFFGQKLTSNQIGRTTTSSLDITQSIFTGGRLTAQLNGAQANILAARESARLTIRQTFRSAIQAYADVLRDQLIFAATERARQVLEQDLSDMHEKFKAGAATISDRAEVLARLAAARSQVASAEGQLNQSRAAYLSIIGQDPEYIALKADLPALPASREDAVLGAIADSPNLKLALFNQASIEAKVALARSAFSPDVSLRLSASAAPVLPYQSGLMDRSLSGAVVVQVPLFSSGADWSKLRQAEVSAKVERLKVEAARRLAIQTAEQAFSTLETTKKTVVLIHQQVRADRVAYESLNQQFKSGLISTIDLLNSEQELSNAEISLATAEHDLLLAEADLLGACGRLEADVLIPEVDPRNPERQFRNLDVLTASLPTTLVVRELDRLAPVGVRSHHVVTAAPLEQVAHPDRVSGTLADMDPEQLDAQAPKAERPH